MVEEREIGKGGDGGNSSGGDGGSGSYRVGELLLIVHSILHTIVQGPKTLFANKLFANTGVNHDIWPLWPLPLHVT